MVTDINMSELPPVQTIHWVIPVRQCQIHSLLRRVKTKISHGHPRVWGLNVGGSNIKINYQWLA